MHSNPRYAIETRNGRRQRVRALLRKGGPSPKRRLIGALNTTLWAMDSALNGLTRDGHVERYRAKSLRGRLDQFWCLAGQAPTPITVNFGGAATLLAMQTRASPPRIELTD
jgi:predicted ArsR family transcriptional regulator